MRIGAIIGARMSSSRLPGKVLRPVRGRPVLQYLLERVDRADGLDRVAVATSVHASDDPILGFCRGCPVACVRGALDNVAQRLADAAWSLELDAFVRLTADSPLIDSALISRAVAEFRRRDVAY